MLLISMSPGIILVHHSVGDVQVTYFSEGNGHSWVVGWGKNAPQRPHHRDSALRMQDSGNWNVFHSKEPNPNILVGALVGGPKDVSGEWADDRSEIGRAHV